MFKLSNFGRLIQRSILLYFPLESFLSFATKLAKRCLLFRCNRFNFPILKIKYCPLLYTMKDNKQLKAFPYLPVYSRVINTLKPTRSKTDWAKRYLSNLWLKKFCVSRFHPLSVHSKWRLFQSEIRLFFRGSPFWESATPPRWFRGPHRQIDKKAIMNTHKRTCFNKRTK